MSSQHTWALRLPLDEAHTLSALRTTAAIQVAVARDGIWLAGSAMTPELDVLLRQVPAVVRYEVTPQRQLHITGERLHSGTLPEMVWLPLNRWVQAQLPTTVLPAVGSCHVQLKLVRGGAEGPTSLLLTDLTEFHGYVNLAPSVRLERLSFAVSPDGRCLVSGTPLPALRGQHWQDHGGFATPAGFHWEPALAPELVRRWLAAEPGGIVLWHEDQTFSRITEEQWMPAERSAVRMSKEVSRV